MNQSRILVKIIIVLFLLIASVFMIGNIRAEAHDAVTGWKYPSECCSGYDCREVNTKYSAVKVKTTKYGYQISTTGETIPYTDAKVRNSPDGLYHWCSKQGEDDTDTICLYVPPPSF